MAQALYRKWRSQTFDQVIGQEHVTTTLLNALREGRVAHAYLFAGPARHRQNLHRQNPRQSPQLHRRRESSLQPLRPLFRHQPGPHAGPHRNRRCQQQQCRRRPRTARKGRLSTQRVPLQNLHHRRSPYAQRTSAFNALLKTLEEPPPYARFVLATTEPHRIPATVLSRCQRFDFRRIPIADIAAHLTHIAAEEGFEVEEAAIFAIARSAQGCMRDAVSLLDQMTSYGAAASPDDSLAISLEQVQQVLGSASSETVAAFVDALAARNVSAGLALIRDLLLQGGSLNEFVAQVIEHLRGVMLIQMVGDGALLEDSAPETVRTMQKQAQEIENADTLLAIKRFSQAMGELKGGFQPQLPLELALVELIEGVHQQPIAAAPPRQRLSQYPRLRRLRPKERLRLPRAPPGALLLNSRPLRIWTPRPFNGFVAAGTNSWLPSANGVGPRNRPHCAPFAILQSVAMLWQSPLETTPLPKV